MSGIAAANETGWMVSGTKLYARDCYNCGQPMEQVAKGSHTLICKPCEVTENGTVQGRFPRVNEAQGVGWGDEMIPYLDHGATTCPSPDAIGYREESVPVLERPTLQEVQQEDEPPGQP